MPISPTHNLWQTLPAPHKHNAATSTTTGTPTQAMTIHQNLGHTPAAHATAPKPHTSPEAARTSATSATTTSSLALSRLKRPIGHRLQRLSQTQETGSVKRGNKLKFAAIYDDADLQVRERIPLSYVRTPATSRYNV